MFFNERAKQVAEEILSAFEAGLIPTALAQIFIHRNDGDIPCRNWSFNNQLTVMLQGHLDARGYRQWQQVGRQVKAGSQALHILVPRVKRAKEDDDERGIKAGDSMVVGFGSAPVFGYSQTTGAPLPGDEAQSAFVDSLPLVEVARFWGLDVVTFSGEKSSVLGLFSPGQSQICLGVENLSTWCHELIHAADHRLGNLKVGRGPRLDDEIVAEFGGAVLLECLGFRDESDRGGAFNYIQAYCRDHKRELISAVTDLVDRTCKCVDLILRSADQLSSTTSSEQQTQADSLSMAS
jgi:hypothetical protein